VIANSAVAGVCQISLPRFISGLATVNAGIFSGWCGQGARVWLSKASGATTGALFAPLA